MNLEHRYHSVSFSYTMSKQLEVGKLNFQNIRVYVSSIKKCNFCLSVTLIVVITTLFLKNACRFFRGKIVRNGLNSGL